MFDKNLFNAALKEYKKIFIGKQWPEEKYKWEAVQNFQSYWDIEAADFHKMLTLALDKTSNLMTSFNSFPKGMILQFAKSYPQEVRNLFRNLFDESSDVIDRIQEFKEGAEELRLKCTPEAKQHYQDENTIVKYLWMRYPDKYYIYKIRELQAVTDKLSSNVKFKKGHFRDNWPMFMALYDSLRNELLKDSELKQIFEKQVLASNDCYKDKSFCTLTIDFGFFVSRTWKSEDAVNYGGEWFPHDYTPDISVDDWIALLNDPEVFSPSSLEIMKRMRDIGGIATCKQLSEKYGESANFYNAGSSSLSKRVHKKTNCSLIARNTENSRWWPILYLGRYNEDREVPGVYIWKLRPELSEALNRIDMSHIKLYVADKNEGFSETTRDSRLSCSIYTRDDFLREVYISPEKYDSIVRLLKRKKNVILQGAPGVGKTYIAKRLAYSMMGERDESRVEMVQFHQSYSYDDFVKGYKPNETSFEIKDGIFYSFCKKALENPTKDYFFIIDEINRGNLSKIFGELLMLIECDHRGESLKLSVGGEDFKVPDNVYIIGMMNTADRSLALIDYALRRRFGFVEIEPGFKSVGFKKACEQLGNQKLDALIRLVEKLNSTIEEDSSLGKGFCIGHSYFCFNDTPCTDESLSCIVKHDILPMLNEYWFDDNDSYEKWEREFAKWEEYLKVESE